MMDNAFFVGDSCFISYHNLIKANDNLKTQLDTQSKNLNSLTRSYSSRLPTGTRSKFAACHHPVANHSLLQC